jgi:putative membrane protein
MKMNARTFVAVAALIAAGSLGPTALAQGKLQGPDVAALKEIAAANIAEIETGKMAVGRSKDSEVKKFAQMMVDDHTKGLSEVRSLAKSKGVDLPGGPDTKHKAIMVELKALKGNTFDKQYVKQAGVGDHEATEKLLLKTQDDAKDADLKALATKMLPTVQAHLKHAQQLASKVSR